jgi:hypothetical protein
MKIAEIEEISLQQQTWIHQSIEFNLNFSNFDWFYSKTIKIRILRWYYSRIKCITRKKIQKILFRGRSILFRGRFILFRDRYIFFSNLDSNEPKITELSDINSVNDIIDSKSFSIDECIVPSTRHIHNSCLKNYNCVSIKYLLSDLLHMLY